MDLQIYTLGCRLNKAESQLWQNQVRTLRIEEDSPWQNRQVIIVNTCVVTAKAEKETRQLLRRLRRENPQSLMVVVGCWATLQNQRLIRQLARYQAVSWLADKNKESDSAGNLADLFIDNKDKKDLVKILKKHFGDKSEKVNEALLSSKDKDQISNLAQFEKAGRYFVKIQDGCNKFCSYCIVPLLRGRSESRAAEEIVAEVKELEKDGAREITLTGVDIAQYKIKDQKSKIKNREATGLTELLGRILAETRIQRVRLGSVYPEAFTDELLKLYSKNWPRLCRHLHISLQSGCNATLARMNRHYTIQEFRQTLKRIRQAIPGVNITTDVIVGFPGETGAEFKQSCENIKKIGFGKIHVFPFSARPGTLAAKMEKEWGRVNNKTKAQRAEKLRKLSQQLSDRFCQQFIGQNLEVLLESKDKEGCWQGLSDNYLRIKIKDDKFNLKPGQIVKVKIMQKIGGECLQGSLIKT